MTKSALTQPNPRTFADEADLLEAEIGRLHAEHRDAQQRILELEDAVAARDAFIGVAGHELRNAMSAVVVAATNVSFLARRSPDLPSWVSERLESIGRQSRGFVRRATTLLDVSRLASGAFHVTRAQCSLSEVVREVVEDMGGEAERSRCSLEVAVAEGLWGQWDREALEQIVVNLISNAIKYGAGAPVRVSVTAQGANAVLAVEDHGIGISDADRARIFGRFERAVRRTEHPGFGIGLWIVQKLVDAHDGAIVVESTPGHGSVFTVTIPGVVHEPRR